MSNIVSLQYHEIPPEIFFKRTKQSKKRLFAISFFQNRKDWIIQIKSSSSSVSMHFKLKKREKNEDRTFNLVRKQEDSLHKPSFSANSKSCSNIFRDINAVLNRNSIEKSHTRPVGGVELFRKMQQQARDRSSDHRKLSKRSNKESTQRNISSMMGLSRLRKDKNEFDDKETFENSPMRVINEKVIEEKHEITVQEELYKSHINFHSLVHFSGKRTQEYSSYQCSKMTSPTRPSTSKKYHSGKENFLIEAREGWASGQRKNYQDKMALLNELSFNRPLIEQYGDQYFEFMLRNRYQEERKPASFIYQLDGKFSDSKVIKEIKKYGPALKDKSQMLVKGRKVIDHSSIQ